MSPERQHSYPRIKPLHAENEKTCSPCRNTKTREEEKEDKKMLWKMYSPSGSKRFQLKRNWAYSGGGLVLCRLVWTEALRPFCALCRCRWLSHVTRDWPEFLNRSELFSCSYTRRHSVLWWMAAPQLMSLIFSAPALFQFLKIGSGCCPVSLPVSQQGPYWGQCGLGLSVLFFQVSTCMQL